MLNKVHNNWYNDNKEKYENLEYRVDSKINVLLDKWKKENNIDIHAVNSRIKERESFLKKLKLRTDLKPEEIEDICGFRIVCYSKKDVEKVTLLLAKEFDIKKIKKKSEQLKEDEVGYQSTHLIVSIHQDDMEPQYENMIFEIQVRTVFQDAWAVISHAKRYKYYGFMPDKIKRSINLFSGTLELLDNTLDDLVTEMLNIQINISEKLRIIEDKFENVSDYIYARKIYFDLGLDEMTPKPSIDDIQSEIFDSTTNIEEEIKNHPELEELLRTILDPHFQIYDISRMEIKFSPRALIKAQNYLEKNLQIVFEQDGKIILEPKLSHFGTIWNEPREIEFQQSSAPYKLVVDVNKEVILRNKLNNFIYIGLMWFKIKSSDEDSYSDEFYHKGNKVIFKDIPEGKYLIDIKVGYEPSNDSYAKYSDLIIK